MSVLIIANSLEPNSGGGRYVRSVLDQYTKLGIEYEVISLSDNSLLPSNGIINIIKNIYRIRKKLKKHKNIHAFDVWSFGVYALFTKMGTSKRLFVNSVGTYSMIPDRVGLKSFLIKLVYKKSFKVFAVSKYVQNRVLDKIKLDNIETVHLGSTVLPDVTDEQREIFKERFNIQNNNPIFLTVGGIKRRKGQFDTFKALSLIKKDYPNFIYVIVGSDIDDVYLDKINKFSKENNLENNLKIISDIPGNSEGDSMLSFLYQSCDIFCLNSNNEGLHFEGFGMVFLEAAQFGKPVIGSNDCGIESAIDDGKNGFLCNQGDAEDIHKNIRKILIGDKEYFSKNSKEFFNNFSWENMAKEYSKDYL